MVTYMGCAILAWFFIDKVSVVFPCTWFNLFKQQRTMGSTGGPVPVIDLLHRERSAENPVLADDFAVEAKGGYGCLAAIHKLWRKA